MKQGCPLSPLLFSLFINDFERWTDLRHGVKLPGQQRIVSHLFYADDLALMSSTKEGLQTMLDSLAAYSRRKGLTVNEQKSKIVVFNSHTSDPQPPFMYRNTALEQLHEFKYLGVVFNQDGSMQHADRQWARALLVAGNRVTKLAKDHGVNRRIDLTLKLQAYAVSAGMYGAQVWATPFLQRDTAFNSEVQAQHLSIRYMVKARKGTCKRSLLHELGQRPYQYYWWRTVVRFWNKVMDTNSALLRDVARSDRDLAQKNCKHSWLWEVHKRLVSLGSLEEANNMMHLRKLDIQHVTSCVEENHNDVWRRWEAFDSVRVHMIDGRKTLTYARWFKTDRKPRIPKCFSLPQISYEDAIRVARFRLGSHFLMVEKGRYDSSVDF